jgi:serine O-acetyltransferase
MKHLLRLAVLAVASPLLLAVRRSPARALILEDAAVWERRLGEGRIITSARDGELVWLAYLLLRLREFRSLAYYRLGRGGPAWQVGAWLLARLYPPQVSLYIDCPDVGPGLYFEHGFSTVVTAERIGRDCWINQQVTIGYGSDRKRPVLGDGVGIRAGAIVIGGVTVGSGGHVGAGAVVTRDVPPNTYVAGVPAKVLRQGDTTY